MKRFLTASLLTLAFVIGATGAAPVAHAQFVENAPSFGPTKSTGSSLSSDYLNQPADTSPLGTASPLPTKRAEGASCPAGTRVDPSNSGNCISDAGLSTATQKAGPDSAQDFTSKDSEGFSKAMTWIMSLFAWLVGVSAMTLDYSVYYTVVSMGNYVHDLAAVGVTWRILRDIGNILIIFGFLAIGIATILNTERLGYGTKMLPSLIMAAVFLNFSLFITEAVIDVGNLFATQFYTQINGGQPAGLKTFEFGQSKVSSEGISNKIMAQLGLQTIYTRARDNQKIFEGGNTWLIAFMGILLFLTTAFVMFSLAFILIARFIMLLFLIIISPVGFAGFAIPQLKKLSDWWKDELISNTITAPVLLLSLYVALAIITDARFLTGFGGSGGSWDGFVAGKNLPGFASLMLTFIVAMGLLIAVIIVSKHLKTFGGIHATRLAGLATMGAISLGARATLGSAGNLLASKRMQAAARRGGVGGLALKATVLAGKGLRSSTFDVRNAPGVGAGLGALGVDAGKGATLTAKQVHDAKYGVKPVKGWLKHSKEEREAAGHDADFANASDALEGARIGLAEGTITQAQYDTIAQANEKIITDNLSKMSTKELEDLDGIKKGVSALVDNLSPQQFEALMKSEGLSVTQKNEIKKKRESGLIERYSAPGTYHNPSTHPTAPGAVIPSVRHPGTDMSQGEFAVKGLTNEAVAQLPDSVLSNPNVYGNLSVRQLNAIFKAGKIQDATAASIGAFLSLDPTFMTYFAGRTPQQQDDLRAFWHI